MPSRKYGRRRRGPQITLWEFPPEDFPAWRALIEEWEPDRPEAGPQRYEEYLALLTAVEREQQRAGRQVLRVRFSVARMRDELIARGLSNTAAMRAIVTASIALEDREKPKERNHENEE